MRFGLMNDALCEIYWVGPKKHNIGMGYICEGDVESERFAQSFKIFEEIRSIIFIIFSKSIFSYVKTINQFQIKF